MNAFNKNIPEGWRRRWLLLAVSPVLLVSASAQEHSSDRALEAVVVTAPRSWLDPNLPTTVESRTIEQLREQNFVSVEDALKHMPATTLRKRYIGDRNALIGGRSSSELQAPRGLVYADGYLLSQFLGQFNAPRWNVVAPEELARVDVLYGPFSALYPGNSLGTTVVMTTRQPQRFEGSARVQYFTQEFEDAGLVDSYGGHQESAWLGSKAGVLSYTISANRLKNRSQPMQYLSLQKPWTGSGVATPVTGAVSAIDPSGRPWYLAGPVGNAIEDNTQEQVKLRFGVDFSASIYGEVLYTDWQNQGKRNGRSLLRDAAGNPVYAGLVSIDDIRYSIPAGSFAPQNVEERHGMFGVTLKTRHRTGWNASAVATLYDIRTDLTRTASGIPPEAQAGGSGTRADNGGTGWKTLDLQSTYTPTKNEAHALAFGYHVNHYHLQSRTFATSDWRHGEAEIPLSAFAGKTSVQALFAQDTWTLSPRWLTTLGMRYEEWRATDGRRESTAISLPYADRRDSAWSPKASVSFLPDGDTLLRLSVGKGVRFPTVAELFQGTIVGNSLVNNNPALQPERALAKELMLERSFILGQGGGTLRASLFEDDVRDTILSQTNTLVLPNVTNMQNIGRVRTRGLELSVQASDVVLRGLDLSGNLTLAHSKILDNANNPATVGKRWVRVPRVRANLVGAYRVNERWTGSAAVRHSGRQFSTLDNSDSNPNTYGGTASYTVWDMKLRYKMTRQVEAALGIDNLFNRKYYAFHPYPGRTVFGELHASF